MSRTIDERVVEMRFDNKQFESGIETSIDSLGKLNRSLDLKGASKGLENVNAASKGLGVGMADLATVVESAGRKFDALRIMATTALVNITNSAVNAGKKLVSSLSIDQLTAGWGKYEQKTANVQTLMNSTGKSIDEINGYLDKLMWFSDETSYGFTDMTAALAQMTSSGGKIEKLIPMITGVANATAYAGKGASEFSRVIYNLNQSYGAGYLQLMDWKSLELAGVGSLQLKETLIQTAEALGKVKKGQVTVANFSETLKDKWADTEVMEAAFGKFGEFSDAVQKMVASGEVDTAAEAIEKLSGKYGALGEKAFRSAQEAKSFSEAIDATKDAVSSGWLKTYEIIFGNYEEAKVLWTDLANTLWDIFASGADARNEMLKEWADLGGRADALEGIVNIFHAIQAIIEPVSEAFSEMFPAITAQRLFEITEKFKILTGNFKTFVTESEKGTKLLNILKSVFKGVFATVEIGVMLFSSIAKAVMKFFKLTSPVTESIFGLVGALGDSIVMLRDFIKETKVFDNVAGGIASVLASMINGIGAFVKSLSKGFKKTFKLTEESVGSLVDRVKTRFESLAWLASAISAAWGVVVKIADKIGEAIGKVFSAIKEALKDADFNTVLDIVNGGLLAGILGGVLKFINRFSGITKDFKGFVEGFKEIIVSVKNAINTFTADIKIGMLKKIATSVAILAASVIAMSLVDSDKLASSFAVLTGLFVDLFGAMTIFQKLMGKDGFKVMDKLSSQMIAIALATLILSFAVTELAKLDWAGIGKGLTGIVGIMVPLTAAVKIMSSKDVQHGAKGLLSLSISILLLTVAVKQFTKLSWDELGRGLGSLAAVIVMLVGFTKLADSKKMGTKLIALSAGILILSLAIKDLASLSLEQVGVGLLALAGALGAVVGLTYALPKNFAKKAVDLALLATAIKILGGAFSIFAKLGIDQVVAGLLALAGSLAIITIALYAIPNNVKKKASTIAKMAVAIGTLAPALVLLGTIPLENVGSALLALGGALGIMIASLYLLPKGTAGKALAIMLVAAALNALILPLTLLGKLSLTTIGTALLVIAGILVIFGIAVYALQGKELTLLALAGALVLLGIACTAVSVAVVAMSGAIVALAGVGSAAVAMIIGVITGIVALIPVIIENIGKGIIAFLNLIAGAGEAIFGAISTIFMAIINVFKECLPAILDLVETVVVRILDILINTTPKLLDWLLILTEGLLDILIQTTPKVLTWLGILIEGVLDLLIQTTPKLMELIGVMLDNLLAFLVEYTPKLVAAGVQIILDLLRGITNAMPDILRAATDLIIAFCVGITKETVRLIDAGFKMIIEFVNGLAEAIRGNTDPLIDAFGNLADSMIDGLVKGLGRGIRNVVEKAKELANVAWNKIKDVLGIHSPSRKFRELGEYSGEGFALGLRDMESDAKKAAGGIGKSAIKTLSDAVSGIADVVSSDIDTTPTIRPVIDLSDVKNGEKELNGMFGNNKTITVDSVTARAVSVARSMDPEEANGGTSSTNQNGVPVFSFTQNNYSPKALSKVEIYRQTKNQISMAKNAIKAH